MTDKELERHIMSGLKPTNRILRDGTLRIIRLVKEAISHPSRDRLYWLSYQAQIESEYNRLARAYKKWAETELTEAAALFEKDMQAKLLSTYGGALRVLSASMAGQDLIAMTVSDAVTTFTAGLSQGKENVFRVMRMTQQKVTEEFLIDKSLANAIEQGNLKYFLHNLMEASPAYKRLMEGLEDGALIQAGSKRFAPDYYAELVARTKFHEVQSATALATANAIGTDLVKVSSHNTLTEECKEHEGKVYSISGKDTRFPPLTERPPFHPNCLHTLHPTFETALEQEGLL